MVFFYITVGMVVYIIIGGFIAGVVDAGANEDDLFVTLFWPAILLIIFVVKIAKLPIRFGKFIKRKLERND